MPSAASNSLKRLINSKWTDRIVNFMLVPAVLVYSLWLPPAALGQRLFHSDLPLVTPDKGGTIVGYAGASLTVDKGAVAKRTRLSMDALGGAELEQLPADSAERLAAQRVPQGLLSAGPWHRITAYKTLPSSAEVSLPIPRDLANVSMGDLYGWNGQEWRWLPSRMGADGLSLEATLDGVPSLLMVAQNQAMPARVALTAAADETATAAQVSGVSMLSLGGLILGADGAVLGEAPAVASFSEFAGEALLAVSNTVEGVVRSDLADNLLIDESQRAEHVAQLVKQVVPSAFAGLELSYAGVDPALRGEFSALVTELATALHDANKLLAVRVDAPVAQGAGWDSGAYDLQTLGQVADLVRVPALVDPEAYAANGDMDQMAAWLVRQVDRRKVDLVVPAWSQAVVGDKITDVSYADALALLAQDVQTNLAGGMLLPGQSVTVGLQDAPVVQLDPESQVYWFEPAAGAGAERVWLGTASSVARKLTYVTRFGLGGALVDGGVNSENDADALQIVSAFQDNIVPVAPAFAFVGTVENSAGVQVAQLVTSLEDGSVVWTAPNRPGNYVIRAGVSEDGGNSVVNAVSQLDVLVPTATFTPTPTPTNTPTATPTATPTLTPTSTPTPRPVAALQAPSVAAVPRSSATGGYFGYGIQAHFIDQGDHDRIFGAIQDLGLGWVKQQVRWADMCSGPGSYNFGEIDRFVDGANARGLNILLSVVTAPAWACPSDYTEAGPPSDPGTFADFVRALASRYKGRVKAYEIWNEQNLHYEWGGLGFRLSAAKYVELLAPAYNAIKSVDPAAVVVSGALTPTGLSDNNIAIDDRLYLEQMYQAGFQRYCDAVGVHPSGYNNPVNVEWQTWSDPTATSFKGHPASFYKGTMEAYRNIMLKYGDGGKRLWVTEFGWATVENMGFPAVYAYANDNSEAEQAAWIVEAYQMAKRWGWVGPMFLWNLNFAPVACGSEKAQFGIVRCDWSPRPAYAAIRDMAK